jgi:hypothetical protein
MMTGLKYLYRYPDKSSLYKAWREYYTRLGLSYNKMLRKVIMRVQKGKYPNNS